MVVPTAQRGLFIGSILLVIPSCVSLDAKPDVQRAAEHVRERTGCTVPWDEPWAVNAAWDGFTPLAVDQAVLATLSNSSDIRVLVEMVAAGRADLAQAGLLPNPVVSVRVRVPLDGGTAITPVGISVTQSFVALWLRGPKIRAADARLNQSILTLSHAALKLVADVKTAHAMIVFGQRGLQLQESAVERSRSALTLLRNRGPNVSPLDVDRLEQVVLSSEAERARRHMQLNRQRRELLGLMGRSGLCDSWIALDPAPALSGPEAYPPLLPDGLTDESAQALALAQRLDVAASLAVVEANKKDLSVQERSRFNDLGIGVVVQRTQEELRSFGFQNSVPLFDFNQAQIAKSGSLGRAALATAEGVFQRATMEARVALGDARSAQSLAKEFRRGALRVAQANVNRALDSLHSGAIDVTSLIDVLDKVAACEQATNDLEFQAVAARITLELTLGGSLTPITPSSSTIMTPAVPVP